MMLNTLSLPFCLPFWCSSSIVRPAWAVLTRLTELPHCLLVSLPSLHVRHFHLAEDVTMTQSVGRGGEGDLGGEGEE